MYEVSVVLCSPRMMSGLVGTSRTPVALASKIIPRVTFIVLLSCILKDSGSCSCRCLDTAGSV